MTRIFYNIEDKLYFDIKAFAESANVYYPDLEDITDVLKIESAAADLGLIEI